MAPIKFEEQIKDKLEAREVSPSSGAWSKLFQQLDAEESQNKKPLFWWFGIAASIALLVFVSAIYFNNIEESSIDNTIVNDKIKPNNNIESPFIDEVKENIQIANTVVNNEDEFEAKEGQTPSVKTNKINTKKNTIVLTKSRTQDVAVAEKVKPTSVISANPKDIKLEIQEPKNIIEFNSVVAELQDSKSRANNTVSNSQIDSLLKAASRDLFKDKNLKNNARVVNAKTLLQDVEEDLGQSFRTRIFESLKGNYKRVKTAVAQRNN